MAFGDKDEAKKETDPYEGLPKETIVEDKAMNEERLLYREEEKPSMVYDIKPI